MSHDLIPAGRHMNGARCNADSNATSAALARNWPFIGLRSIAAALFGLIVVMLPLPTTASLILLFAAYVAADGACAILAGARAAPDGRSWMLILEGMMNLLVAGAVLVWPETIIVTPFVDLAGAWAIITGGVMLASARRLSVGNGRWLLVLAGGMSAAWGILAASAGPSSSGSLATIERWLTVYALVFAVTLFILTLRLRHSHLPPATAAR
jgi:uncharacterized membrane protein HdeD (DUF308 family)